MTPLTAIVFSLLLKHGSPGQSTFSAELVPACGSTASAPSCVLAPVCTDPSPLCAAPRFSEARGGWVRAETRERATARLAVAAQAIVDAAVYLTRCTESGVPVERCKPVRWPEGPEDLARAIATMSIWESGMREDIMAGIPPKGRGPDGEACAMQLMPATVRLAATWLPDRDRLALSDEAAAAQVLGTDRASLRRCYEAGGRIMARLRGVAAKECPQRWSYSMWARYGTAGKCSTVGIHDDFASKRETTFLKFRKTKAPTWPDWFTPELRVAFVGAAP